MADHTAWLEWKQGVSSLGTDQHHKGWPTWKDPACPEGTSFHSISQEQDAPVKERDL